MSVVVGFRNALSNVMFATEYLIEIIYLFHSLFNFQIYLSIMRPAWLITTHSMPHAQTFPELIESIYFLKKYIRYWNQTYCFVLWHSNRKMNSSLRCWIFGVLCHMVLRLTLYDVNTLSLRWVLLGVVGGSEETSLWLLHPSATKTRRCDPWVVLHWWTACECKVSTITVHCVLLLCTSKWQHLLPAVFLVGVVVPVETRVRRFPAKTVNRKV